MEKGIFTDWVLPKFWKLVKERETIFATNIQKHTKNMFFAFIMLIANEIDFALYVV